MARAGLLVSLLAIGSMVVGCSSQQHSVAPFPEPNFSGPVVETNSVNPIAPPISNYNTKPAIVARSSNIPSNWVPIATAERRQWTWIVVHHSATPTGGAGAFDKAHRAKGWDELGYHFVIGNGTDTGDGQIEVGSRWPVQKHGAHAKTPDNKYNEHGIGICLVGNFDLKNPSSKQLASLAKLVAYLADTYHIKQDNILGHKMTGKQTDCPGNYTNIPQIRAMVAKLRTQLVDADVKDSPGDSVQPDTELMQTVSR